MTPEEDRAAKAGILALDAALRELGKPGIDENPDFEWFPPKILDIIPNVALRRPGVAPLLFIFGPYLEVCVGPYSEVYLIDMAENSDDYDRASPILVDILRSEIECRRKWLQVTVTFSLPGSKPWRRLGVLGRRGPYDIEGHFRPYAPQGD